MAYFVILDRTANLVDSYDNEPEARERLAAIAREADEYAMITYDDQGHPVGEALTGSALGVHA